MQNMLICHSLLLQSIMCPPNCLIVKALCHLICLDSISSTYLPRVSEHKSGSRIFTYQNASNPTGAMADEMSLGILIAFHAASGYLEYTPKGRTRTGIKLSTHIMNNTPQVHFISKIGCDM